MIAQRNVLTNYVAVVEGVSAFGAKFRSFGGIRGFPAALVAFVLRDPGRLRLGAFHAELAFIQSTAFTCPAVSGDRLRRPAFHAEFPGVAGTPAFASPA